MSNSWIYAVALMAVASARAGIIYSGPVDRIAIDGQSIAVSMDGTDTVDFFLNTYVSPSDSTSTSARYTQVKPSSGTGLILPFGPVREGNTIGPGSMFSSDDTMLVSDWVGVICVHFSCQLAVIDTVNWPNSGCLNGSPACFVPYEYRIPVVGYLGLEFTRASLTYFGWARISTKVESSAQVELYDYAFNDRPNTPIRAGQMFTAGDPTSPVSEPNLSILLAAAAAMALLRRNYCAAKRKMALKVTTG